MHRPTVTHKRPLDHRTRKGRTLRVPIERDRPRIRQLKLAIENVVEPVLPDNIHGWRPDRSVQTAVTRINSMPGERLAFDIRAYFDQIDQQRLKRQLDRLDPCLWPELERWLPEQGLAQGVAFSPVLANLYLAEIDRRHPTVRYADNVMIIDPDPERIYRRLQRQLGDVGLTCHQIDRAPTHFCKTQLAAA